MTKYVTVSTAAERLGVRRETVWRWVKDGYFEGVRRKGLGKTSAHLIPVESVLAVAEQLGIELGDVVIEELEE